MGATVQPGFGEALTAALDVMAFSADGPPLSAEPPPLAEQSLVDSAKPTQLPAAVTTKSKSSLDQPLVTTTTTAMPHTVTTTTTTTTGKNDRVEDFCRLKTFLNLIRLNSVVDLTY